MEHMNAPFSVIFSKVLKILLNFFLNFFFQFYLKIENDVMIKYGVKGLIHNDKIHLYCINMFVEIP